MELNKSEFTYGKGKLNKFMIDCKNDIEKYTELINILYKSDNFNAVIIKTLYNNKKNIVLKIGFVNAIKKEYEIYSSSSYLMIFGGHDISISN